MNSDERNAGFNVGSDDNSKKLHLQLEADVPPCN